jgi:integrase
MYREHGRLRRVTIGSYPRLSLADARREALRLMREAGEGASAAPALEAVPAADVTFAAMAESYVDVYLRPNTRSWKNVQACLGQKAVRAFNDRDAASIERREIVAVLDGIVAAGTPHAAVNLLKALRAMYNWAMDRDLVTSNPCERIRAPAATTQRDRILTDQEIAAVWRACDKVAAPFGSVVRMLILTGARRNEIAQMRWSELEGNIWTLPATRSKSGRVNVLTLPPAAMTILAGQPRYGADGFVFTTTGGKSASSDFAKRKIALDRASATSGWTLHDLRRSARSRMSQIGVSPEVARRVVGHATDKLDATYDRYSFNFEKAEALRLLADHLQDLVLYK